MNQLARYNIDCVVCTGMGRRAIEALNSEGIKIYEVNVTEVQKVVDKLETNSLIEMDPLRACHGHGQRITRAKYSNQPGRGAGYGMGGCRRGNASGK
jgi:predicted Fe-Mo cluster-binding NifX family protein